MGALAILDLELPELMTVGFDPRCRESRSVRRLGVKGADSCETWTIINRSGRETNLRVVCQGGDAQLPALAKGVERL